MLSLMFITSACLCSFIITLYMRFRHFFISHEGSFSSILVRRSSCDSCHKVLTWYEMVPILSWLSLGGECVLCKVKIGWAVVLSELLSGIGGAFIYLYTGDLALSLLSIIFILVIFSIMAFDYKYFCVPTIFLIILTLLNIALLFFSPVLWEPLIRRIGLNTLMILGVCLIAGILAKKMPLGPADLVILINLFCWLDLQALPFFMIVAGGMAFIHMFATKQREAPFVPYLFIGFLACKLVNIMNFNLWVCS